MAGKHWAEDFPGVASRKTKFGGDIGVLIRSGKAMPESKIGVYASDADSFDVFRDVIDGAMSRVATNTKIPDCKDNKLVAKINELAPSKLASTSLEGSIVSSRVRIARNLTDYPFANLISKEQRLELQERVSSCLAKLEGEFAGTYTKIEDINKEEWKKQGIDRFLFENSDSYQTVAGMYGDWPSGRGIFLSKDRSVIVWVAEEDHLRVQCMEKHHDLRKVFGKVFTVLAHLEKSMTFGCDPKYGWMTSCPTNLGIGMRASVHVNIGKVKKNFSIDELKEASALYSMEVRGIAGENTGYEGDVFDISNKKRTYDTVPADAIEDVVGGVTKLVMLDRSL